MTEYQDWQIAAVPGAPDLVEKIAELDAARPGLLAARKAAQRPYLDASVSRRVAAAEPGHDTVSEWVPRDDVDVDDWKALKRVSDEAGRAFESNLRALSNAEKALDRLMLAAQDSVAALAPELAEAAHAEARAAWAILRPALVRRDSAARMAGRNLQAANGATLDQIEATVAAYEPGPAPWTTVITKNGAAA